MARSPYPGNSRDFRPKTLYISHSDHEDGIYEADLVHVNEPTGDSSWNDMFRRMSGAQQTEYQPSSYFVSGPTIPGQRYAGDGVDSDANEATPPYPRQRRRTRYFAFFVYDPDERTYSLGAHVSGKGLLILLLSLILVGAILYQIPDLFEVLKNLIL